MASRHVVILGSGPAGLGAAYRLTREAKARVTVLERQQVVGGLAGSFDLAGVRADYGSHRLHPSCEPAILADIRSLLGPDLLDRPRHGRIRLRGRWIHFPLKPLDLVLSLPPGFALGTARDMVGKTVGLGRGASGPESFASVLRRGLGATICRDFYFPYARKIWGRDPEELSAIQARRRVKAGSLGKLVKKVLSAVPGLKPKGAGKFYYPRGGFGQIVEAYAKAAKSQGADIHLGSEVGGVHLLPEGGAEVEYTEGGATYRTPADHVWSTIPVTQLAKALRPAAPESVLAACDRIRYRSMVLIYLVVACRQFTGFDAHYFPESDVPITRLSEPKNYSTAAEPPDRTVLCAELPCERGDSHWNAPDEELGKMVADSLAKLGIPLPAPVLDVTARRLPQAYPIYEHGYETALKTVDAWLDGLPSVLTLGRQGLFAHDNTHHTLAMAYAAAECLGPDGFDRNRWHDHKRIFETHVVED
jgi:protoporphyrinogen oxidase